MTHSRECPRRFVAANDLDTVVSAALARFPLAVRWSATAEDMADLSFAGQQDTFLNVQGRGALLIALVDCWSSLWTARAIGYRLAAGVDQRAVSLAVVVQRLASSSAPMGDVPAQCGGVLWWHPVRAVTHHKPEEIG